MASENVHNGSGTTVDQCASSGDCGVVIHLSALRSPRTFPYKNLSLAELNRKWLLACHAFVAADSAADRNYWWHRREECENEIWRRALTVGRGTARSA